MRVYSRTLSLIIAEVFMQNKQIIGLSILTTGILFLVDMAGIVQIESSIAYAFGCVIYGLLITYHKLGKGNRLILFSGGAMFILGVSLIVSECFLISNNVSMIIPSIFFAAGAGFVLLFAETYLEKRLLIVASLLFIAGAVTALTDYAKNNYAIDFMSYLIFYYWEGILIITGVIIILNWKRT